MRNSAEEENLFKAIASNEITIKNERVDDIPLLFAQMSRMNLKELIGHHFPAHGNWEGLSAGQVTEGWLCHILSLGDHCLCHVETWAENLAHTLKTLMKVDSVRPLDFADDRLAGILESLSDDDKWIAFEEDLGKHLLRVYDLNSKRFRIDTTTSSGYWEITPDGIFQFGHSKDYRPDLPQVKTVLGSIDPLGLPIAADVVAGNCADDPLYIPVIKRIRDTLNQKGLLFIGDCKMAALETRAYVESGGDFYLCPLSSVIMPEKELDKHLAPVWAGKQKLTPVLRKDENGKEKVIAEGFESSVEISAIVKGEKISWTERRLFVRSSQFAEAGKKALMSRLTKALDEINALNERGRGKVRFKDRVELETAVQSIIKRRKVPGIIEASYHETLHEKQVRNYGKKSARIEVAKDYTVCAKVNEVALEEALRKPGWRVYVANHPKEHLPIAKAILAYRDQYIIERGFGRLKGKSLSISPMYLERDDHATGLLRLLTIGLRVLTLLEFAVRRRLAEEQSSIAGLYPYNPKRENTRPTAELILKAFENIELTMIQGTSQTLCVLSPLSNVQQRILELLDFSSEIYTKLAGTFCNTS